VVREIVIDTETTGLDPDDGHRVVEIGGIELVNHLPTGRNYHQYINPERPMPREAERIHGLNDEFLRGKPAFARIVDGFLGFIGEAKLVIHNAAFDMAMLNAELSRLCRPTLPMARAIDTLDIARRRFPGAQHNLDALCKRFGVDNSAREKHGALLDSELLAEVYLELLGGRQRGLTLTGPADPFSPASDGVSAEFKARPRPRPLASRLTEPERVAHEAFIAELGADCLWARFDGD